MARVNKRITFLKAIQSFATYAIAIGAAMTQVEIPQGDLTDKALITLGLSTLAGVLRAVNNVHKRRKVKLTPHRAGVNINSLVILGAFLALSAALPGCIMLRGADGSMTYRLDGPALETAWEAYEALVDRKANLEDAKRAARVSERAAIEKEIRALEAEIQAAWRALTEKT